LHNSELIQSAVSFKTAKEKAVEEPQKKQVLENIMETIDDDAPREIDKLI